MSLRLSKYVFFLQELFLTHRNPFVVQGGQAAQRLQRDLWIYGPVLQRASLDVCETSWLLTRKVEQDLSTWEAF